MRKHKISFWHKQCLVVLLLVGCLVAAVGSTWARYRTDVPQPVYYESAETSAVKLWSLDEGQTAAATDDGLVDEAGSWTGSAEGGRVLSFGISNGEADAYSAETQGVRIKLLGTLGINYTEAMEVSLEVLSIDGEAVEEEVYTATASAIMEASPLWDSFGSGWVFEFEDEFGEELYWVLEGEKFSYMTARISITGMDAGFTSLLQLVVESDMSKG